MINFYTRILTVTVFAFISVNICNAQTGTLALKMPPVTVSIDGRSAEWGDSLSYYNTATKVHYAITNDKTSLYLVVKTKDPIQENDILMGGLTFSIDIKGRKRNSFTTSFPFPVSNNGLGGVKPDESIDDKRLTASVTKFKKIGVNGFKHIDDDEIAAGNPYGIATAIGYDNDGSLVYEEVIPLALFHAGDLAKGEWAFNIRLNGHAPMAGDAKQAPSGSGVTIRRMVAVPRGSSPSDAAAIAGASNPFQAHVSSESSDIDFWGKFTLAQ